MSLPTYFFDVENCRHLPADMFIRYMEVCQVLAFDRLSEDFTGTVAQLDRLSHAVTVFDFFVTSEALRRHPDILEASCYRERTYPKSFSEWQSVLSTIVVPLRPVVLPAPDRIEISEETLSSESRNCDMTRPVAPCPDDAEMVPQPLLVSSGSRRRPRRRRGGRDRLPDECLIPMESVADPATNPLVQPGQTVQLLSDDEVGRHIISVRDSKLTSSESRSRLTIDYLRDTSLGMILSINNIYQPKRLVLKSEVEPGAPFVEEFYRWRTLPSEVFTADRRLWSSLRAGEKVDATCVGPG